MPGRKYRVEVDRKPTCPLCCSPCEKCSRAIMVLKSGVILSTMFRCPKCGVKVRVQIPYDLARLL